MRGFKLLIVAVSAAAALAVGLGAHASPQTDDVRTVVAMFGGPVAD
jgi:hypothetical protein